MNLELESAIDEDPRNVGARLRYADWLTAAGDPRGELIRLQHQGSEQADEFLQKHRAKFLGPLEKWQKSLDGNETDTFTWRLGFIHSARFAFDYYANEEGMVQLGEGLDSLLRHPSGRFLEELTLGLNRADPDCNYDDLIDILVEAAPRTLNSFFCADFEYPDQIEMSWTELGDFSRLWPKLPRLQKLIIQGGSFTLGKLVLPELRHAEFRTGGLRQASIKSIAEATWPKLERLDIWFGDDNYGAEGTVEDILPILEARGLPKLKHLGLMNCQFANDLPEALAKSKILRQLETLDLSMGVLKDSSIELLAKNVDAFKHLKTLNLEQNLLGDAGIAAANKLGAFVSADDQRDGYDEDDNFVAVGE